MTQKKKVIISVLLFVVIFAGLLVTATFTDFQVSQILTKGHLTEGEFYTNDTFGAGFEAIGTCPIMLMIAFACEILFWFFVRHKGMHKVVKIIGSLGAFGGGAYGSIMAVSKISGYVFRHAESDNFSDGWNIIVIGFVGLIIFASSIMAVRNFSDEQIGELWKFGAGAIGVCIVAAAVVSAIKVPFGRIRYRAMNMYPDDQTYGFAAYQRWYEIKGQWIPKETMTELFGTTDALKSFPSGHTADAGATYALIMLPPLLKMKKKWARALCWICPFAFTTAVAISRIMVGAHFFSDVLVGGTISFVAAIIFREILVCKGSNVKAVFSKKAK